MRGAAFHASDAPDLVVLDVRMPGIDGFQVCRNLRSAGYDVPIVFLTARDAPEDRIAGLTSGGDDYVTKPFGLEELIARIRAVLRRTGVSDRGSHRLAYADLVLDEESLRVMRAREHSKSPTRPST